MSTGDQWRSVAESLKAKLEMVNEINRVQAQENADLKTEVEELRGIVDRKEFRSALEYQASMEREVAVLREALESIVRDQKSELTYPVWVKAREALETKSNCR